MNELDLSQSLKNRRAKLIRCIEFSDRITRINRRETLDLEERLKFLREQQKLMEHRHKREVYEKRFHLTEIVKHRDDSMNYFEETQQSRESTFVQNDSMRRNQSAPPTSHLRPVVSENQSSTRPKTTPGRLTRNRRTFSLFKNMMIKPPSTNLTSLLILFEKPPPTPIGKKIDDEMFLFD